LPSRPQIVSEPCVRSSWIVAIRGINGRRVRF
jgi:hypothetical protein